jgi:hypothetical protein
MEQAGPSTGGAVSPAVWDVNEAGIRYAIGDVACDLGHDEVVLAADDHQRRDPDIGVAR